ncbi:MAG: 16S rRNA (uracil(1498)-N(3))-methyltransferase [Alphaproteobacteria bacterium]|jgi:16S rRNA (uracil1498-N3)-methyltransferase|nr:16S rRNA (uracil(1498)-N(3))-methyltransferase [Alphaproteobacteria bacterium]
MSERAIRLHTPVELAAGVRFGLDARATHYLAKVMRATSGDVVRLFNARDGEWRAELTVAKRAVTATALERVRPAAVEPGPTLAVAALKRARLELVVEKATELGVAAIQPLATARAVVDRVNHDRLAAIATEAAEQSERLTVPAIAPLRPLDAVLAERAGDRPLYAAVERADASGLAEAVAAHGAGDLLIGPEGGFAAAERAALAAAPGVVAVSLGPRVLRAETAAIAGLAVLALRMSG